MKNFRKHFSLALLGVFMGILIPGGQAAAQAPEKDQTIKIKVIDDNNGEQTVIEKEFSSQEELMEYMKEKHPNMDLQIHEGHGKGGHVTVDVEVDNEDGIEHKTEKRVKIIKNEKGTAQKITEVYENGELKETTTEEIDMEEGGMMIFHGSDVDGEVKKHIIKEIEGGDFNWESADGEVIKVDVDVQMDGDCEGKPHVVKEIIIIKIEELSDEDIESLKKARPGEFTKENLTSLDATQMEYFPNPSDGEFTLRFELPDTKSPAQIRIMDMQGKEVYTETWNDGTGRYEKQINLKEKPAGTYFIIISQKQQQLARKFVIW